MSRLTDCQIRALLPGMRARMERLARRGKHGQAIKVGARITAYEVELAGRSSGERQQEPQRDLRGERG